MRRVAVGAAGLAVVALPALALAQDPPPAIPSVSAEALGVVVATIIASLVTGGAAGQWRAVRAMPAPADQSAQAAASAEAIAELRRDLRALAAVVDGTREAGIRSGERLEALSARLADIHRMVERIEEAARVPR